MHGGLGQRRGGPPPATTLCQGQAALNVIPTSGSVSDKQNLGPHPRSAESEFPFSQAKHPGVWMHIEDEELVHLETSRETLLSSKREGGEVLLFSAFTSLRHLWTFSP